ncbi:AAA family ATPase [Spirochaeta cellobiosiphila]|uniref:AAA family ATPase n=1 Tax=Spirochaeta cellobiosiphila TaxID=504483 RepID=UPI0003F85468|nr:AAA family ATPase [Spirochaeta cellobiosiphila]
MIWKFPYYEINTSIDWTSLEQNFVWFQEMKNIPQDPEWHAEGDVFTHTKMVVEALVALPEFKKLSEQDKHILFSAALLHDIEKRSTTTTEVVDGITRIVSPKHAKRGEAATRSFLYQQLAPPFAIREEITHLVRYHGLPLWVFEKANPEKEVVKASLVLNTEFLYILAKADVLGRISADREDLLCKIELFKELCLENVCFGQKRNFSSHYARYLYLNKQNMSLEYEPYDDLGYEVILLSGLPGTGKDTYIQNHLSYPVVSLDDLRRANNISPTDRKGNGRVVQLGKETCKEYLRNKMTFVFNATNITKELRNKWISLFIDYKARVKIIYLEVPFQQLLVQNQNRENIVPEGVIDRLIQKLEIPTYEEAHEIEYIIQHSCPSL